MAMPIGTPLQLVRRCPTGTHQWKVTNRHYNLKYTMCTYIHWHMDMHAALQTMVMRPCWVDWNIQCVHPSTGTSTCRQVVIVSWCANGRYHGQTLEMTLPMCWWYPTMEGHQYTLQLEIYHVYIPAPAHGHPAKCCYHGHEAMVSGIEMYHVYIPAPAHRHAGSCWDHGHEAMVSGIQIYHVYIVPLAHGHAGRLS